MIAQLAEPYRKLEEQKRRFVDVLEGCTPEQLAFRVAPDAWTLVQVGHHVTLAEQQMAESIRKHRGIRSSRRSLRYQLGNAALRLILKTGIRVQNPLPEIAPDPDIDLPTVLELWERTRQDLEAVLEEVKPRGLEYAAFKHPVSGPCSVREAIPFLVAHLEHHTRQLERIRQDPAFPGTKAQTGQSRIQ